MHESGEFRARIAELERELSALRQREIELSDFIDNASVGLHWVGPDGTILWANQAELDLLGYTQDEYVGHHIGDFHVDRPAIDDILRRLQAKETLLNYEARLLAKDGSIRHVLINSNVRWDSDVFVHTRCFTRDITERKRAEQELREAHEVLQALVHASPLPIIVFTPDGNITLWNPAAERVFGWRAQEVLGGPIPFVPSDKLEEQRSMRARNFRGEGFIEREVRRRRKDGSAIDLRVSTAPLRDEAGTITAIMSAYVDVTERKRFEQRLMAQYRVARILGETSSLAEAAPKLLETLCEDLGWQQGVLWTLRAGEEALRCVALWHEPSEQSGDFETICRGRIFARGEGLPGRIWATGQPAWITDLETDSNFPRLQAAARRGFRAAFGFPIVTGGKVLGVAEFFSSDIQQPDEDLLRMAAATGYQIGEFLERERAQKTLAEREESYRVLTETASDGILAIDAQSRILFANSAAGRIFGYGREEMMGGNLTMLMPDYLRHVHRAAIGRYLETGQRHISWQAVALPGRHKDGKEISLEISFAEYEQDNKHIFIGMVRDVTERNRFDEQLRQTAKLESLGLLAGGIAHDFNNLLTGIMGNVSLALDTLSPDHPANARLRDAAEASDQAAHLTKQLLAYAGKGRFVIRAVNLSALIREITTLVKTSIPKTVQLRLDLAENIPCIEADATQIQQMVMNLVINGAEAIPEGREGTVLIATGVEDVDSGYIAQTFADNEITPGRYVSLQVHDTGMGMDEATQMHIFDPFFTTKFTGRGLGLAGCRSWHCARP